jgi:flagellar biosynthesis GTPase FlhF
MSDVINPNPKSPEQAPSRFPWLSILLLAGLVAAVAGLLFLHNQQVNLRLETAALKQELATVRQAISSADVNAVQTLAALRSELENLRKENASASEEVRRNARRQAEAVAARVEKSLTERQIAEKQQIAQQLDEIKSRTEQATARLTDITSEVGAVKNEVATSRSEIDKTIAELRRVTGDLGVLSGLIATNSKELAALKQLGDRDYYEFSLSRQSGPQRIGDVVVQLKKADVKRNRFTVEIVADDKKVEKKDRTINEPVQFYVPSKARIPYELVVNEVKKDNVVGYLAAPKVKTAAQRL